MLGISKEGNIETHKRLRYICLKKGITVYSVINELANDYINKNLNSYDIDFLKDKNIKDIIREYKKTNSIKNLGIIKLKEDIDIEVKSSFPVYESPKLLYDNVIDLKPKSIPVFINIGDEDIDV